MLVRRLTSFVVLLAFMVVIGGCAGIKAQQSMQVDSGKVKVVCSFFALADFTEAVGGQYVSVTNIMPTGADHHEFEPTLQQRAALEEADLLIVNGLGMEHWLADVQQSLGSDGPKVISVGEQLDAAKLLPSDPHVWLDPNLAGAQVKQITTALIQADPKHEAIYTKNSEHYLQKIQNLDAWAKNLLQTAKGKTLVVSHGAFGYLARAYGLQQLPVLGIGSEVEPNPQQLTGIIERCRQEQISYIYIDEQESSKAADIIAKEIGAGKLPLYSGTVISEEQRAQGVDYLQLMRTNLQNISEGLGGKN